VTDTDIPSTKPNPKPGAPSRRAGLLAGLVAVQAICAVFFVVDVTADFTWDGADLHTAFEAVISLALVLGVVFGALEIRRTLDRMARAETALSVASGALAGVIETYFERWALTGAEANVALLAIKGFEVAEIAELRGATASTVRVQLAKVYAKAGVASRTQLLSVFIEDLMGDDIAKTPGPS
jgi:DNA-binding CsgD family transcriptional regulator